MTKLFPALLTALERLAGQVVNRRIEPALGERRWWPREAAGKEKVEQEHGIGQVDRAAVVHVSTLRARRFFPATEEMVEHEDGVREVLRRPDR